MEKPVRRYRRRTHELNFPLKNFSHSVSQQAGSRQHQYQHRILKSMRCACVWWSWRCLYGECTNTSARSRRNQWKNVAFRSNMHMRSRTTPPLPCHWERVEIVRVWWVTMELRYFGIWCAILETFEYTNTYRNDTTYLPLWWRRLVNVSTVEMKELSFCFDLIHEIFFLFSFFYLQCDA